MVENVSEGEAHCDADNGSGGGFESGGLGSGFRWWFGPRAGVSGGGGGSGAISLDGAVRRRARVSGTVATESLF
jgi:hypothetical protein